MRKLAQRLEVDCQANINDQRPEIRKLLQDAEVEAGFVVTKEADDHFAAESAAAVVHLSEDFRGSGRGSGELNAGNTTLPMDGIVHRLLVDGLRIAEHIWEGPSILLARRSCSRSLRARPGQISRITGMIRGLRPVVFWISRLSSTRTFSLTMP